MRLHYGYREIDWRGVLGAALVVAATLGAIALMGRPL